MPLALNETGPQPASVGDINSKEPGPDTSGEIADPVQWGQAHFGIRRRRRGPNCCSTLPESRLTLTIWRGSAAGPSRRSERFADHAGVERTGPAGRRDALSVSQLNGRQTQLMPPKTGTKKTTGKTAGKTAAKSSRANGAGEKPTARARRPPAQRAAATGCRRPMASGW